MKANIIILALGGLLACGPVASAQEATVDAATGNAQTNAAESDATTIAAEPATQPVAEPVAAEAVPTEPVAVDAGMPDLSEATQIVADMTTLPLIAQVFKDT